MDTSRHEPPPSPAPRPAGPWSQDRRGPASRGKRRAIEYLLLSILVVPNLARRAGALVPARLEIGEPLPELALRDLEGREHRVAELRGRSLVICFGELYNENTLAALAKLAELTGKPPLAELDVRPLLIVGTRDPTPQVREDWEKLDGKKAPALVLHDRERSVFEAFDVKVLPTFVVADREGKLVLFMSGYPLNFADMITDGVLYAEGRIAREELEQGLAPPRSGGVDEERLKAIRTARMASALARRQLHDLAVQRFEEAIRIDPTLLEARVGLAAVRLEQGRVQEAETLYREALQLAPASVTAHLGLARIEIKRDQLTRAEKRLKEQEALHSLHPEIQFLLGTVHERLGRRDEALQAYKKAARLLLERARRAE